MRRGILLLILGAEDSKPLCIRQKPSTERVGIVSVNPCLWTVLEIPNHALHLITKRITENSLTPTCEQKRRKGECLKSYAAPCDECINIYWRMYIWQWYMPHGGVVEHLLAISYAL